MREPFISKKIPKVIAASIIIMICMCNISTTEYIKTMTFSSNGHMKYSLLDKSWHDYVGNILKKYKSYDNSYMLSMNSMYFDIESNKRITYFDIPLYGNFGYDGINKMKKKIDNMHDVYFFIKDDKNRQFANKLTKYIRNNTEYKENIEDYEIYYKE